MQELPEGIQKQELNPKLAIFVAAIFIVNAIDKLSLRGTEWLRGAAEANPEIPRAARNKLRNPMRLPRFARNDSSVDVHLFMTFTIDCAVSKGFDIHRGYFLSQAQAFD
jgi:hypothetical protein